MAKMSLGRKVSEGVHKVRIVSVEDVEPKKPGAYPQAMVTYEVIEEGSERGVTFTDYMSYSPKTAFRWHALYDALQLPDDWASKIDTEHDLDGKELRVQVEYDTYGGQVRAKVAATGFLPFDGGDEDEPVKIGADGKGKGKTAPTRPTPFA